MEIDKFKTILKLFVVVMMIINAALLIKGNISLASEEDVAILLFINVIVAILFSGPYLYVYQEIGKIHYSLTDIIANGIGVLIMSIASIYMILDIKSSSDAQSGIALIIVPPLQIVIYKLVIKIFKYTNPKLDN